MGMLGQKLPFPFPFPFYIGLPMWGMNEWVPYFYPEANEPLSLYSQCFNTVEGNTSFYALPSKEQVCKWHEQVNPGFKFSFKLLQSITHKSHLKHCSEDLRLFFGRFELLSNSLGPVLIQLPPSFTYRHLDDLSAFIKQLPSAYKYSIELRHQSFFGKDEQEKTLNDLLIKHGIDRWSFDTRLLRQSELTDEATIEAKQKKPNFSPRANCFGQNPGVRLIGESLTDQTYLKVKNSENPFDMDLLSDVFSTQHSFFQAWVDKLIEWVEMGLSPYVFLHMPNNEMAPLLGAYFYSLIRTSFLNSSSLDAALPEFQRPVSNSCQIGFF